MDGVGTYCRATFNYVDGLGYRAVESPVIDGRSADIDFETMGFELVDSPSDVTDWTDPRELDEVHAGEIADLAKSFTGCDETIIYPSLVRNPAEAAVQQDHAPIETVHSDFTDDYGRMIVEPDRAYRAFLDPLLTRKGMSVEDVKEASRVMMLQFWRNTGPRLADKPLAFCDASTVPEDRMLRFVVSHYGGERLDFETFLPGPPEDGTDDWYTFPSMHAGEAVAIRTYDSARVEAGLPYWTPHAAFADPHAPDDDAHRRQSVEMRSLCLWR